MKKVSQGVEELDENELDLDLLDDLDEEAIAKLVESAPEAEKIDSAGVKRLMANFEKAFTENTKMREKYAEDPTQFLESEMALDQSLKDMQAIATAPEHYIELLKHGTHDSILSLLAHDNPDISIGAIDLLRDLLGADVFEAAGLEDEEQDEDDIAIHQELVTETIRVFTSQLLTLGLFPLLESCLNRFDENVPEEKQGVYNTLDLMENLLENALSECTQIILEKTQLIKWLLNRISSDKFGAFDDVKLYASEILCILAQSPDPEAQKRIGSDGGIELLLKTLSKYRKEDPSVAEEEEVVENICNILCVTAPENESLFMKNEGLDLMRILIKSNKYVKRGAVKIASFFVTNNLSASAHWMDIGGLGTLFSAFMHQSKVKESSKKAKKKKKHSVLDDEENIISMLAALFTNFKSAIQDAQSKLSDGSEAPSTDEQVVAQATVDKYSAYIERLVLKFAENNAEKLERLVALHGKYFERMNLIDAKLAREDDEDRAMDEQDEEMRYKDRLEAGLFTLQLLDYILVFVTNSMPVLKSRAQQCLQQVQSSWADVKSVLLEFSVRAAVENGDDPDNPTGEALYLLGLVNSISL